MNLAIGAPRLGAFAPSFQGYELNRDPRRPRPPLRASLDPSPSSLRRSVASSLSLRHSVTSSLGYFVTPPPCLRAFVPPCLPIVTLAPSLCERVVDAIVGSILLGVVIGGAAMLPLVHIMRRRAEVRARDAERRAHEAERLAELGSMTSGLAHEIKNPLSTIGLNAQLLGEAIEESDLPAEQRERLRRRVDALGREAERLGRILTDFLQFAGRMQLDPQPRHLGEIVDEMADFFLPQCHRAGVTLRTSIPAEPITVALDERLFKQALLNLLINAVQAMTPSGERNELHIESGEHRPRELMIRVEGDEAEARVHVTDTGPGIEPARTREIFRPYVSGRSGGTGLGLPTTRRIVEEHGGRLEVHSEPGRGSDFVIHLKRNGG